MGTELQSHVLSSLLFKEEPDTHYMLNDEVVEKAVRAAKKGSKHMKSKRRFVRTASIDTRQAHRRTCGRETEWGERD
jgi:hypothetical protein